VGGQCCCPIDDAEGRVGVGAGGGLGAPSRQGVPGYNPEKSLKFYMQNPAFWHIQYTRLLNL